MTSHVPHVRGNSSSFAYRAGKVITDGPPCRKEIVLSREFLRALKNTDASIDEKETADDVRRNIVLAGRPQGAQPAFDIIAAASTLARSEVMKGRNAYVHADKTHAIWSATTAEEAYTMFETNFPHMDVRCLVPYIAMRTFVHAKKTIDGPVERCDSLVAHVGSSGEGAVFVLGAAAHALPADDAQVLNADVEDLGVLMDVLDCPQTDGKPLAAVAAMYAARRDADTDAMVELLQPEADSPPCRHFLSGLQNNIRSFMSRRVPKMFCDDVATLILEDASYEEVLARRDEARKRQNYTLAAVPIVPVLLAGAVRLLGGGKGGGGDNDGSDEE